MKTLKIEAVYLAAYESFVDVTADLPGPASSLSARSRLPSTKRRLVRHTVGPRGADRRETGAGADL